MTVKTTRRPTGALGCPPFRVTVHATIRSPICDGIILVRRKSSVKGSASKKLYCLASFVSKGILGAHRGNALLCYAIGIPSQMRAYRRAVNIVEYFRVEESSEADSSTNNTSHFIGSRDFCLIECLTLLGPHPYNFGTAKSDLWAECWLDLPVTRVARKRNRQNIQTDLP